MHKTTVVLLVVSVLMSGCATIFKGSSERITISSSEPETKVFINGQYVGKTPYETKLLSKNVYNIEFRKDGYESKTVVLNNGVGAGWIVLDVLFGGVPIIVDAATGNWMGLENNNVAAALEPIRAPASTK